MVFNVHAGHNPDGKVACGAIGIIQESTEARKVKNEVISQLRQLGHTVYDCTCDNGTSQANVLKKIVNACNSHEADLDVSIHLNSGAKDEKGNGKTTGVEVYCYKDYASSGCVDEANRVCEAISALGFKNRGVKYTTTLYVVKNTKAPAILIECCFVDDKDDVQLYDYQSMASAIVYGITGQKVTQLEEKESDQEAAVSGAETTTGDAKQIYRVQVGSYSVKGNADSMAAKLKAAGFDAIIVKA